MYLGSNISHVKFLTTKSCPACAMLVALSLFSSNSIISYLRIFTRHELLQFNYFVNQSEEHETSPNFDNYKDKLLLLFCISRDLVIIFVPLYSYAKYES